MTKKCDYILTIGKNKGNHCPYNGIHTHNDQVYCKKHLDKFKRDETQTNTINNDPVFKDNFEPTEEQVKTKKSIFNITINSNKNYYNMTDQEKLKFKKVIEYLFYQDNLKNYLKDMSNPTNPLENIINMRSDYKFEVGDKLSKLHVHGIIDITHNGFYQIKTQLMRTVLNRYLDSNVHLNIQAQKSASSSAWDRYINKNHDMP